MIRPLTGIQMGPRQLELPPNMPVSDSAGKYPTPYAWPPAWKTYGCSAWNLDRARMPNSLRNSFSSSILASTRRSFWSSRMAAITMDGLFLAPLEDGPADVVSHAGINLISVDDICR